MGSNSEKNDAGCYSLLLECLSNVSANGTQSSSKNFLSEKSRAWMEKKKESDRRNPRLVRAIENSEENGLWVRAAGCGGPRWKGRDAVIKVISFFLSLQFFQKEFS